MRLRSFRLRSFGCDRHDKASEGCLDRCCGYRRHDGRPDRRSPYSLGTGSHPAAMPACAESSKPSIPYAVRASVACYATAGLAGLRGSLQTLLYLKIGIHVDLSRASGHGFDVAGCASGVYGHSRPIRHDHKAVMPASVYAVSGQFGGFGGCHGQIARMTALLIDAATRMFAAMRICRSVEHQYGDSAA